MENRSEEVKYLRPDSDVYVYLLSGVFPARDEASLGPSFIGNWVEGMSSFLFFSAPVDRLLTVVLKGHPCLEMVDTYHFSYEDWQGGGIEPMLIGKFSILPPWDTSLHREDTISILLDPGVVFGNALHPTTRDCLLALTHAWERSSFASVLDLGTGTGILALAAASLGAESVTAVDLNPLCVKTTRRNVALNGLEGKVRVVEGTAEDFTDLPCDLAVANMHYEVISRLMNTDGFRNKTRVILSGLLRSQWSEVRDGLRERCFEIVRELDQDMTWFTILAERTDGS